MGYMNLQDNISMHATEPRLNPGQRLYAKGMIAKQVRAKFLEEMRQIKRAKEESEAPFRP